MQAYVLPVVQKYDGVTKRAYPAVEVESLGQGIVTGIMRAAARVGSPARSVRSRGMALVDPAALAAEISVPSFTLDGNALSARLVHMVTEPGAESTEAAAGSDAITLP